MGSPTGDIMQTIHKVCLTLTGVCVVILCVGIGIGIGHRVKSDSNDTSIESNDTSIASLDSIEYEAYDDKFVKGEPSIHETSVLNVLRSKQKCDGTIIIFLDEKTDRHLLKLTAKKKTVIKNIRK